MSLVFLKNSTNNGTANSDDHMKPYAWSNNFDTPLILPPDSQVAYISSTMQREKTIILTDADNLWFQIGNQQLNIPMPLFLTSPNGLAETWSDVANRIIGNEYIGKTDFMYDGQSGGYIGTYTSLTDKLAITLNQRLQPTIQDVWANNGNTLSAAWSGLNQVGISVSNPPVNPNGNNIVLSSLPLPGAPGLNLWNCGWSRITLGAGGQAAGALTNFGNNAFSIARSSTGIKRAVFEINSNGDELGGALQIRGTNRGSAPGAVATSEAFPYVFGLNSLQCCKIADAQGSGGFDGNCSINGGFGGSPSVLAPNVVNVRITDAQEIVVEVMTNSGVTNQPGVPIDVGAWGNVEENAGGSAIGAISKETGLLIVEKFEIATWLATALNQPQNVGAEASQPYNATLANTELGKITFGIQWTTPYTFQIWAGTGFEERTGRWEGTAVAGSNYAGGTAYASTYTILYDSQTGGCFSNGLVARADFDMYVPEYFGDLGMCAYIDRRNEVDFRGNFDVIKCYSDTPVAPYPSYDVMLKGIDGINFAQNPTAYPNAYHLKTYNLDNIFPAMVELDTFSIPTPPFVVATKGYVDAIVTCICGALTENASVGHYQKWYPQPEQVLDVQATWIPKDVEPSIDTGVLIGLIKPGDDGEVIANSLVPNNFTDLIFPPTSKVGETDQVQSVHIQLTNLPINGRNGMTSTKTATIAVVHNAKANLSTGTTRVFETYQPEKNWIDLNNAGEMTLNELRVYISDDANAPARFLNGKSDVVVMFRQKPAADRGISTQPINKFGLTPSMGATTIKM